MIVIPKNQLPFLLNGRTITIVVARTKKPYRMGRVYAVGLDHHSSTCHAQIVAVADVDDKTELKIQHAPAGADRDRWLARSVGYSPHLAGALLHEDVPAVDAETQARITDLGTRRWQQDRRDELERQRVRSLNHRLREAQRRQDADAVAQIRRDLEDLEQQMRDAA